MTLRDSVKLAGNAIRNTPFTDISSPSNAALTLAPGALFELLQAGGEAAAAPTVTSDPFVGGLSVVPPTAQAFAPRTIFGATDPTNGRELWITDGTAAGTTLLRDINPGSAGSNPQGFFVFGNQVLFAATTAANGQELWITDGTTAGTQLLVDINPGTAGSSVTNFFQFGSRVLFSANDGVNGTELWVTDGTAGGTALLRNIVAGSGDSFPSNFVVLNGTVIFTAADVAGGSSGQLWQTDGTTAGTTQITNIANFQFGGLTVVGNRAVFQGSIGGTNRELWVTDGTSAGTGLLREIESGVLGSFPNGFTAIGGRVVFTAVPDINNNPTGTLWVTDGTFAGTRELSTTPGNTFSNPFNGFLYYQGSSELWRTDGVTASLVRDINPTGISSPQNFTAFNGRLYFNANDGTNGTELWSTDGTSVGTVLVRDINAGAGNAAPGNFAVLGSSLLFAATDATNGRELWITDGTTGGTTLLTSINPGTASASPAFLTTFNAVVPAQAPVAIPSGGTAAFIEGANVASTPVAVDPAITVSDSDSTTLASATVSITTGLQTGQDVLGFSNTSAATFGNIAASYAANTGVLTLTSAGATATVAQFQAALRAVTYTNSSDTPDTTTRTVSFVVNDGGTNSTSVTRQVSVTAVNDAPSGTNATLTINEDAPRTLTAADFGFSDVDGNSLAGVRITTLPSAGTLTLSGAAVTAGQTITVANLPNLVFTPAPNANGTGYASFTFQVQDNGGTVSGGVDLDQSPNTLTFNVSAVNDAPTVAIVAGGGVFAPVGSEIRVNTATANGQDQQQITALSNGGFVVTWRDNSLGVGGAGGDASSSAVKAQVFAASGAPVGSEILVNTATALNQDTPQITALSNGGFVVTWQDGSRGVGGAGGDTSGAAVKAQVFGASGAPVGSEILVNTAILNGQFAQQITALSNGGFVVTWQDGSGAGGDPEPFAVKAQVFGAGGTPVGSEILVNTATARDQTTPQITALSNGGFVVTWTDRSLGVGGAGGDANGFAVKAQVFAADSTPVGSEILVNTATVGDQDAPQITALSNGGFVITWRDNSLGAGGAGGDTSGLAVKAQLFAAGGAPVGSEIRVNTATTNSQTNPQITALSDGGFVVTWRDNSQGAGGATGDASGFAVKAQVFAAGGAPVGSEILVNTATANAQDLPQITALSNGGFVVTWRDGSLGVGGAGGDTSGNAIKAQVFSAAGVPAGSEILVNTATANAQDTPQIRALSNGGFVVTWVDNSLGVGGAGGDTSSTAVKAQVFGPVTAYVATEQVALSLKGGVTIADVDAGTGTLTATLSVGYGVLNVAVGTSGATIVSGNGTGSVVVSGTLAQLNALLASDATSTLAYTPNTDTPPASTTFSVSVNDGGNTGSGGAQTGSASVPITITAVNDPAVAVNDPTNAVNENATVAISVLANDSDPENDPFSVASINGTAATVGVPITLASGATATLNANGTISYNPNGQFNYLVSAATAAATSALNSSATDSFTYQLNGGGSATVTVQISGVDGTGDQLRGDGGNNAINGTSGNDFFNLSQGGNDAVSGGDGNDAFLFGAAFTAADTVDGGNGTNDQIGLQGNYSGANALTLGASTITNVEVIAVLPGFSYSITTNDGNVGAGQVLTIFGGNLGAGDNFIVNASAETNGALRIFGGLGIDTFTGGAGDDGFYFGPGRFNPATDTVNGGAGTNDQVALDGSYTATIGAAQLQNVEVLALLRGVAGDLGTYNITLADDLIGAGQTFTVFGLTVETGFTLNASAESNGNVRVFGGTGSDTISTGAGADRLFGGSGGDVLNGGLGADTFVYDAVSQSTGAGYDRVTGFVSGTDRFDFDVTVTGVDATVSTGTLSAGSFDANLAAAIGAGQLAANHAVLFQASAGSLAGQTFLIVDANGVAGYQAGSDYVVQLVTPPASLVTSDFI